MDEPIDLAQKAAEKGNPWFGMGNLLTGNTVESANGTLTLADIEALQERMFDNDVQAGIDEVFDSIKSAPFIPTGPDYMVVSPYVAANWERWERRARHSMPRERAQRHRIERWQKIRKRQRRAAQRRHARGES